MRDHTIGVIRNDFDSALYEFLGLRNTYLANGWENPKGFHIEIEKDGQTIITGDFTCSEVKRLTSKQPISETYPHFKKDIPYEQIYERLQLIENILGDTYRINDIKKEEEEEEDQELGRLLY